MNPLAAYFLKVMKAEPSIETRRYEEYEAALQDMGYWVLTRPIAFDVQDMPSTSIQRQCKYLETFRSFAGDEDDPLYAVAVDVYADPKVASEVFV